MAVVCSPFGCLSRRPNLLLICCTLETKVLFSLVYWFIRPLKSNSKIQKFVQRLSKRRNSSTVFNPYRDSRILKNIEIYFEYMAEQTGDLTLLVGEAPGYKGCRITGIPFTSGALIRAKQHHIFEEIERHISLEKIESENSASFVWQTLIHKKHYPLFWNAFPFHPHPKGIHNRNRAPNKKELLEGADYLAELVEIFSPITIAGIGRKGVSSVEKVFPGRNVVYIRHPSYGGKKDFLTGMDQILNQANAT